MNTLGNCCGLSFLFFLVLALGIPVHAAEPRPITARLADSGGATVRNPESGSRSTGVITVGRSGQVATITEAAALAIDGDIVEILPGEYIAQPVVWTQANLTIRGIGKRPVMLAGNTSAEGKAIWVIRNGNITIENIEFRGARVPDGNGAGIRFEKGHLTLRNCAFYDNEMGLLTSNFESAVLDVVDSEFGDAPRHFSGALHHLLYVGTISRFSLVGSRFQNGFRGHLVKSRARESYVAYNFLYDGSAGAASYELEFPNGGVALVIGNTIGQAATSDNSSIVAYGAEGARWAKNSLLLSHNTLINEMSGGRFVDLWMRKLPANTEVAAFNNLLIGVASFPERLRRPADGNVILSLASMVPLGAMPSRVPAALISGTKRPVVALTDLALRPLAEFSFPVGTRLLRAEQRLLPGAFHE